MQFVILRDFCVVEFKTLWPGLKNALFTRTVEKIFSTSDNHFPDSLIFFPLGKGIEWTPKTAVNLKIGAMAGEGALKLKSKHFIKRLLWRFVTQCLQLCYSWEKFLAKHGLFWCTFRQSFLLFFITLWEGGVSKRYSQLFVDDVADWSSAGLT